MNRGFTLVELLIVVGIFLILAAMTLPIYGNMQSSSQLNEKSSLIIQTIRIAHQRSVSGLNNKDHGVYFRVNAEGDQDKFVLYQGSSYGNRDQKFDREYLLEDSLSFNLPDSSSEYDLNFSQIEGIPNKAGTVILSQSTEGSKKIVINKIGMVGLNAE